MRCSKSAWRGRRRWSATPRCSSSRGDTSRPADQRRSMISRGGPGSRRRTQRGASRRPRRTWSTSRSRADRTGFRPAERPVRISSSLAHLLPNYDEYFVGLKDRTAFGQAAVFQGKAEDHRACRARSRRQWTNGRSLAADSHWKVRCYRAEAFDSIDRSRASRC